MGSCAGGHAQHKVPQPTTEPRHLLLVVLLLYQAIQLLLVQTSVMSSETLQQSPCCLSSRPRSPNYIPHPVAPLPHAPAGGGA